MKRLMLLVTAVLVLAGCAPDENTATEMQEWFDACEQIESCAAKMDELTEQGLTESQMVQAIQAELADHEARIAAAEAELLRLAEEQAEHAARITALEQRMDYILYFDSATDTATGALLAQHQLEAIMFIMTNTYDEVLIEFNLEMAFDQGYTLAQIEGPLKEALYTDMQNLIDPSTVMLRFYWAGGDYTVSLVDLFPEE